MKLLKSGAALVEGLKRIAARWSTSTTSNWPQRNVIIQLGNNLLLRQKRIFRPIMEKKIVLVIASNRIRAARPCNDSGTAR